MSKPETIQFKTFLRIFKDSEKNQSESRFCFILGAGASVSSGIDSGAKLANAWIKEIKEDLKPNDYDTWISEKKINEDSAELHYPEIYQKRFEHNAKSGHEALMKLMTDKTPSVGYPFFAQLLVETHHNIVITTNFDSLLEASVYRYTNSQPLVIGHENLAHFLNSSSKRPIIAKIHRDLLLNPINDAEGTSSLPKEWIKPLKQILETSHIVVVGYGGNDGSLMDFLCDLDNRNGIYWCQRESDTKQGLSDKVETLLKKNKHDRVVNIPDFDGLMIELADIFKCKKLVDSQNPSKSSMVEEAKERAKQFQKHIDDYAESSKSSKEQNAAVNKLVSHWYDFQIKVHQANSIEEKEAIYLQGIEETGHASLMGNFANFLFKEKKDMEGAQRYYQMALELEPEHANINGNYASFLYEVKNNLEGAQRYYQKALELDPEHVNNNGNYASFLHAVKKDMVGAQRYYQKALELDPENAIKNGNYATFLQAVKKDMEGAQRYYQKALELDPEQSNNNGNYSGFLFVIRQDELGIEYLDKAKSLSTDPGLNLELFFYEYAHLPERRENAEKQLNSLLGQGFHSEYFDLSQHVERAIEDGHPDPEKLASYAKRIANLN